MATDKQWPRPIIERFLCKTEKAPGGCWNWMAGRDKDGYGKFTTFIEGKRATVRAHRWAWEYFNGVPLDPGLLVCHRCDNPSCVNPDHLFIGTHRDNQWEAWSKGRKEGIRYTRRRLGLTRITIEDAREMRRLHSEGMTVRQIAEKYSYSRGNVLGIIKGERWRE